METKEMVFKMPQFEIKYFCENDWKKVSEKDFLIKLLDNFTPITPVLSKMFQGKEIIIRDCMYRIQSISY